MPENPSRRRPAPIRSTKACARLASFLLALAGMMSACGPAGESPPTQANHLTADTMPKTDDEWRKILSPEQFEILRKQGTERAFTGKYWDNKAHGMYACAGCGLELFDSSTKFESGTGWPSFYQPIVGENVEAELDETHGMVRTEVHCNRCKGHLGHRFPDGPKPTGQRYCINSASLNFIQEDEKK